MILLHSTHPGWLSNSYLVAPGEGGDALVVDSGAPLAPLFDALESHSLRLRAILTTHRHPDHVAGNPELARRTGVPIFALAGEAEHVAGAISLRAGEHKSWDGIELRTLHLPGHTAFQAGYHVEGVGLFCGDCLFAGSIGGNMGPASTGFSDIRVAIVERILEMPDETPIFPGHAEPTTVGRERSTNPFVRVMTGLDPEGSGRCLALGRGARLVVLARDFDGRPKAWVRFDDDALDAVIPGSFVEIHLGLPRQEKPSRFGGSPRRPRPPEITID